MKRLYANSISYIPLYVIDWELLDQKIIDDLELIVSRIKEENEDVSYMQLERLTKDYIDKCPNDCFKTIEYLNRAIEGMENPPKVIDMNLFNKIFQYEGYDGLSGYAAQFVYQI